MAGRSGFQISAYLFGPRGGRLEAWLWSHRGWPNAVVADLPGKGPQRGLVAAFQLRPMDFAVLVPHTLVLRPDSDYGSAHMGMDGGPDPAIKCAQLTASLASKLLEEQKLGLQSKWHPWIEAVLNPTLNPDALGSALVPTEIRHLAHLLAPRTVSVMEMAVDALKQSSKLSGLESSEEKLSAAVGAVMSRAGGICDDIADNSGTDAGRIVDFNFHLCPSVDMANMATPPVHANARLVNTQGGGCALQAIDEIKVGQEVTISNGELLTMYGFSLPVNPNRGHSFLLNSTSNDKTDCAEVYMKFESFHLQATGLPAATKSEQACLRLAVVEGEPGPSVVDACKHRSEALRPVLKHVGKVADGLSSSLVYAAEQDLEAYDHCLIG